MNNQLDIKLAPESLMSFETNEISTQADIEFTECSDQSTQKLEITHSKRQNRLKSLVQHCLSTNSEAILLKIPEIYSLKNNSNARLKIKKASNYQLRKTRNDNSTYSNNSRVINFNYIRTPIRRLTNIVYKLQESNDFQKGLDRCKRNFSVIKSPLNIINNLNSKLEEINSINKFKRDYQHKKIISSLRKPSPCIDYLSEKRKLYEIIVPGNRLKIIKN